MGNLSKLLLDQSAQFPSEPLLAPESLTNFLNMHFTEKNTFCDPFCYLLCLPLYFKHRSLHHFIRISLFNAQLLLSLRPEGRGRGGFLLVKRENVKNFA